MKRTLVRRGAVAAACAAVFLFGSCDEPAEYDARTDTVLSLETPSVSAKAYPGVNFVSWKPVTGASSYKLSVYEEGAFKEDVASGDMDGLSYADTDIVNGKNYTYYVEAVSKSNPGTTEIRAVYATNSRGEASARAIVPPAGTKSLELPAYEGGYDGTNAKTVSADDKWIVRPDNIAVSVAEGTVSVTFPMKAYLGYTVKYYNNDLVHDENVNSGVSADFVSDAWSNNALGHASFDISGAGTYQIAVVAESWSGKYAASDEVVYGKTITVEKLNLGSQTGSASAEYISTNENDKKVRVSFSPAQYTDSTKVVPTAWYKVYRRQVGEYTNTEIAAVEENTDEYGNITYYVDDTVPDAACAYTYTIVVTNSGKYGESAEASVYGRRLGTLSNSDIQFTQDYSVTDKYKWTISFSDTGKKATLKAYYLDVPEDRDVSGVAVLASEIKKANKTVTVDTIADIDDKAVSVPKSTDTNAKTYLLIEAMLDGYETTNYVELCR